MKIRNTKKIIGCMTLCAGIVGFSSLADAATSYKYSATIPVTTDYETYLATKQSSNSNATNDVSYVEGGRKLVSWVEEYTYRKNLTSEVSYSSGGKKYMKYYNASNSNGEGCHLNISTAINNWTSTKTNGYWSPDSL
ncbi:TPA: hypothetical protein QCS28_005852 [Bacillus thuringiensis]|nr:hypothetical protein [Bacillus thuringiensis]